MSDWFIEGRYDFSVPEAQWLSDLAGIDADLDGVLRLCGTVQRLAARLGPPANERAAEWIDDFYLIGDIQFAAVVKYGRTLTSGVRKGIPRDWIDALPRELQNAHEYFKVLRDKFVAHSVSQLEDNQVFVMLAPQFSERQTPSHITVDVGRQHSIGSQEMNKLKELAEALRGRVKIEIESEQGRLLELARSLSIEEIKARGSKSAALPRRGAAFKPRSRFK